MDDTVSRKAVIDGLWKMEIETRPSWLYAVLKMVNELPSATPRRCMDCETFNLTQMIIPQQKHSNLK